MNEKDIKELLTTAYRAAYADGSDNTSKGMKPWVNFYHNLLEKQFDAREKAVRVHELQKAFKVFKDHVKKFPDYYKDRIKTLSRKKV